MTGRSKRGRKYWIQYNVNHGKLYNSFIMEAVKENPRGVRKSMIRSIICFFRLPLSP
jgi:hypothetical protein